MTRYIPFLFVLLWSTGFVGAKFGLINAEAFTILMWRMVFVVPLFILLVIAFKRPKLSLRDASIQGLVGLLIHGFYLGGTFAAIGTGISAGVAALIVSLNPLFVGLLSGLVLKLPISSKQWVSLILGLVGVSIVIIGSSHWAGFFSPAGFGWLTLALFGIVSATLIQKRYASDIDLITGTLYQYIAALAFFSIMAFSLETRQVDWNITFIATLAWLVLVLSLAAILLLMYMIRHGEASRVASYFYLVPPVAAFWGWLFFDERWSWLTIAGAIITTLALMISTPGSAAINSKD